MSSGCSLDDSVSPVSAVPSLATAQMFPAVHAVSGRCSLPSGEVSAPIRSSSSWSGCPRAGKHAHERDPTHVGVRRGLHDLGEQRPVGVAGEPGDRLALRRGDGGQRVLERRRERLGHDLEQFGHADAERGGEGKHRVEAALGDGLLQVLDQHRRLDRLSAEIAVHEGLVFALGDDPLDERVTLLRHPVRVVARGLRVGARPGRVVVQRLGQQPDQPADPRVA
jgi:hypothetical protein